MAALTRCAVFALWAIIPASSFGQDGARLRNPLLAPPATLRAQSPPLPGEPMTIPVPAVASPASTGIAGPLPGISADTARPLTAVPMPAPGATEMPVAVEAKPQTEVEKAVAEALKKRDAEKKAEEEKKKQEAEQKRTDTLYGSPIYDLFSLYDNLSRPSADAKKWYEKLSIRGYVQLRYGKTLLTEQDSRQPNMFGDRSINGDRENLSIRRARLILFGDVSDYLSLYWQNDMASLPQGATASTFFAQLRDLYADIYLTKDREHRIRAGLSKVPYGFENMQSSQNRVALDRTDALNTGVAPNERDLGLFYYWTPEEHQKLFKTLVDGGLKGSGNYGIFAFGIYNGQGGSTLEANDSVYIVSRLTYPFQLGNSQIVEASIQGLRGHHVVTGATIRPRGVGATLTPANTSNTDGILDERAALSFVWYPQPFGIQAEWQIGRGPGLNDAQTAVVTRPLDGGYVLGMYRHETDGFGILTPYIRYQTFTGGFRNQANAPYGSTRQWDLGMEWQIRKELELVVEYNIVSTPNFTATTTQGLRPYGDFEGNVLRFQLQLNY